MLFEDVVCDVVVVVVFFVDVWGLMLVFSNWYDV